MFRRPNLCRGVDIGMLPLLYRVSVLEVYKNTCLFFSTQKLYEIYVLNSVQSKSKIFLCTSVNFNVGTRGEFRPRQTRQLPRAVDFKGRLLSCQSY